MKYEPSLFAPAGPSPGASLGDAVTAMVFDLTSEGFLVVDGGGKVLAINAAGERLLGRQADALRGLDVGGLLDSGAGRKPANPLLRLEKGGRTVWIKPDGTRVPLQSSTVAVEQAAGRRYVIKLRQPAADDGENLRRDRLRARLFQMSRVTGVNAMGSTIAHEINQPLTALSLYLHTLDKAVAAKDGAVAPDVAGVVRKAMTEARRATDIVRRMRSFVEQRAPEREWIEINRAVEEAVDLTLVGRDANVVVLRRYDAGLPLQHADRVQLQQVVVNLVRNALDAVHGRANAEVIVSTFAENGNLKIRVADNGPGIPAAKREKLFAPFESSKADGLGLGLAISRAIAQNHGGDLAVEPGYNQSGAAFTLSIPLGSLEPAETGDRPPDQT
jgi:two-component system sensor kinase FixL